MKWWGIVRNIGNIISLLKAISQIIKWVAEHKSKPGKFMLKDLIDRVQALLDSGAIDIPGVDEKMVSEALEQIEKRLMELGE